MQLRESIAAARRVVVKVGSSAITSSHGNAETPPLDAAHIDALVDAIAQRHATGTQLVLVSSGAIAAGFGRLGLRAKPRDMAGKQASASVGQMLLVSGYAASFARHDMEAGQVLLSADDVLRRGHYRNAQRTLDRLLALRALPVVNENDTVATDEIKFGDNDRLAALVAHVVHADALLLLSDVAGLYTEDPRRSGAQLVHHVSGEADLVDVTAGRSGRSGIGSGGMASKLAAARTATAAGVHVVLSGVEQARAAMAGEPVGTYFTPTGSRLPTRLLWLRHLATPLGRLNIDAGAADAVLRHRRSLLAAGIIAVSGEVSAGDPVEIVGAGNTVLARGLINYDSAELPPLLGRSSSMLDAAHQREVVHRDDLVLL